MSNTNENLLRKEQTGLIPVSKWNDFHPYPTVKALRQLIFFKEQNGFDKVLRKIGGRIYILESEFFKWVEETGKIAI
ncbi:hypothetical protein IJV79_00975 [bacterium]|nr:hypothetical protein [bacterium]